MIKAQVTLVLFCFYIMAIPIQTLAHEPRSALTFD